MPGEPSEHEPILPNAEQDVEEGTTLHSQGNVHIASEAEKRIFWWKTAVINSFFILAWYNAPTLFQMLEPLTILQVPFCNSAFRVQQMDVFAGPL